MSLYAIGLSTAKWCASVAGWTAVIISPFMVLGTASVVATRMDEETRHQKQMNQLREEAERIRLRLPVEPAPATAAAAAKNQE
jgi:protein tyrosine phosphatase (PTP) superfamily phosphohydrolase (DUF442 family)